jgi:peptidoglycan-associated lipoprotein
MYNFFICYNEPGGEPLKSSIRRMKMKQRMMALLAALSMTALVAGGCANKDVVKTEEPAAATVRAETPKPVVKAEEPAVQRQAPEAPVAITPADSQPVKAEAEVSALETVYFDFDKSDLRQDARNTLTKNAEVLLKSRQDAKIKIEGHCDERGSAEYNLALGERRATSALQYLITLGGSAGPPFHHQLRQGKTRCSGQ